MRIERLNYLVEMSKYDSMNKAAEELYISQSTLRSAIASLEDELGVTLVQTTRHGTQLTAFGERVVHESKLILDIVEGWKRDGRISHDLKEELTIGISQIASYIIFQNNILDFKKNYPNISLRLLRQTSSEIFQMLKYGKCNMGIILAHADDEEYLSTELAPMGQQVELVFEDTLDVCINKGNPLADKDYVLLDDCMPFCYCGYSHIEMYPNKKCEFFTEGFDENNVIHLDAAENILNVLSQDCSTFAIMIRTWQTTSCFPGNVVAKQIHNQQINDIMMNHYLVHRDYKRMTFGEKLIYSKIKEAYMNLAELQFK